MSVDQFKSIFWLEYAHRMAGRAVGFLFGVPLAYFFARGKIPSSLAPRLGLLFCMGGAQGLVGWWMVKSGLEAPAHEDGVPRVSPYRLAAHLTVAFTIYTLLLYTVGGACCPVRRQGQGRVGRGQEAGRWHVRREAGWWRMRA
jgi:cytochrome c oxidase assembly protein subunit 15